MSSMEQTTKKLRESSEPESSLRLETITLQHTLLKKDEEIRNLKSKLRDPRGFPADSRSESSPTGQKATNEDLIALHISEMRELKKGLELSIKDNDALRSQLEHRLQMVERDAENIRDPALRPSVIRDNDILRTQTIERHNVIVKQKSKIEQLVLDKQK